MRQESVIKKINNIHELEADWGKISRDLGWGFSIFSDYVWYLAILNNFYMGKNLLFHTLWDNGTLLGIAPFFKNKIKLHGVSALKVGFVENRNSLHNDFIVQPSCREEFTVKIFNEFFISNIKWDVILIKNIPSDTENYRSIVNFLCKKKVKWLHRATYNSPYLVPEGSWEDYFTSRSKKTKKTLRNIRNSLHKAGEVVVRNIKTWDEFSKVRDELYQVAKQSWTDKIGDSLATPKNRAFFDDLAEAAAAKGWLSVWALYLDGKMIAFEFHLKGYGKDHAMRGSYLPEFAHLSPGTYLEMEILKDAFDGPDKIEKYDFGGSFDQYKRKWTKDATQHCEILIFNDRLYSRLLAFHEMKTVPFLKKIRDRFKRT